MNKSTKFTLLIFALVIGFASFNTWAINQRGRITNGRITAVNMTGKLFLVNYLDENSNVCQCKIIGWPEKGEIGDIVKIKVHPFFSSICRRQ